MFTKIVVSVVLEVGSVFPNLPTANNSFAPLYIPTVVTYGSKNELVAKLYIDPCLLDEIILGFNVKLNSLSPIVHLYCVSYIPNDEENEQVTFEPVTKFKISSEFITLPPYNVLP
jgi:hypothetical protein